MWTIIRREENLLKFNLASLFCFAQLLLLLLPFLLTTTFQVVPATAAADVSISVGVAQSICDSYQGFLRHRGGRIEPPNRDRDQYSYLPCSWLVKTDCADPSKCSPFRLERCKTLEEIRSNTVFTTSWSSLLKSKYIFPDGSSGKFRTGGIIRNRQSSGSILKDLEKMLNDPTTLTQLYSNYREVYGKNDPEQDDAFSSSERNLPSSARAEIFKKSLMAIAQQNLQFEAGKSTWVAAVNRMTDLEDADYPTCSYKNDMAFLDSIDEKPSSRIRDWDAPDRFSWATASVVSPIKNQATKTSNCGACYAFAAVAAMEAFYTVKDQGGPTRNLSNVGRNGRNDYYDFSEQQIVDCMRGTPNGCVGGGGVQVFKYIQDNGLTAEKDYPYEAKKLKCRRKGKPTVATLKRFNRFKKNEKDSLRKRMFNDGLVWCTVRAGADWSRYSSGLFTGNCGKGAHSIALMGYDYIEIGHPNKMPYWDIKNSWGPDWGWHGTILIPRNEDKCGVESANPDTGITIDTTV